MIKKQWILLACVLGLGCLAPATAQAEDESDVFRFRESIVVQDNSEISSAVSVGAPIDVRGTVKENAVALGGDIIIGPGGAVEGDAIAIGGRVVRAPGAHVGGKITSLPFSMLRLRKTLALALPTLILGMGVVAGAAIVLGSLGSIALAVLVLLLFPGQTRAVRQQIDQHPAKIMIAGFIGLLMSFPVLVFLMITIIGIPLAFVLAVLLMAALILGTVGLGQWLGDRVAVSLGRQLHPVFSGLIGLFLLTLLAAIPFLGVFFQVIIACVGLGAVGLTRFRAVI